MSMRSRIESSFHFLLQSQLADALSVAPMTSGEMLALTDDDLATVRWDADSASDTLPDELTSWLDEEDQEPLSPLGPELTRGERSFLSERWMRVAENSHSEIGAFARTTLNLMNLDAPLELLSSTQYAGLSTMRDADLALEMSSRFSDGLRTLPEVPLDEQVPLVTDLSSLAICVFHELCVGPTLRAVRVSEQLRETRSPEAARALGKRLGTHSSSSELGWGTLMWALREGGEAVRSAVFSAAAAAQGQIRSWEPQPLPPGLGSSALRPYGVLTPEREQASFLRAWRKVVLPGIETLLSTHVVP